MNPMQGPTISTPSPLAQQRPSRSSRGWTGQATVEFAIVSILFLMIVLGTLDFGRAIYMDSQLTNAVREGARYGQVAPTDTAGIQNRVIQQATGLGLTTGNITATCSASCTTGSNITVKANLKFKFIAQRFLGLGPLTMYAQATDAID
jgi:Flp pilus assembly protein TadG